MKKTFKFAFLFALAIYAQYSFSQENELRVVKDFQKIEIKSIGNLYLSMADTQQVKIQADSKQLNKVKTEVVDGRLIIYNDKGDFDNVDIYIQHPQIKEIKINGIANVKSLDTLKYDNLFLGVFGAGNMNLMIESHNLKTQVRGAGDIQLKGSATVHEIQLSGAGDLEALDLITQVTNAKVSGAGDIRVHAVEELNVKVSGAGNVYYNVEPAKKSIEISGIGEALSWANDSVNVPDTTKLKFKDYKFWIIGDNKEKCDTCKKYEPFKHWAGFEMGVNGYLNDANGFSMPAGYDFLQLNYAKSFNYNLNILEKDVKLYKEYVKLISGLGFEFNSYSFDNDMRLINGGTSIAGFNDSLKHFKKNKLNTTHVTVPLMIAFNTGKNPNKSFHFSAGLLFGYRIGTRYKQKYEYLGENYKNVTRSNYHLSPYRYGIRASIGYGDFNLYATYALSDMFMQNKGPELHPFSIGLRILPF
jgi:hypothetical protein